MSILNGLKTCRKGLHQYPTDEKQCPECQRKIRRNWYERNKEQSKRWAQQNPEKKRKCNQRWEKQNPEKVKQLKKKYRKANLEKHRANEAKRRAQKKQATPSWANQAAMKKIYEQAAQLERKTGISYHVDHIYPLENPYLCGLHVENNLQILTEKENCSKSNRTWPGQLEIQKQPIDQVFTSEQLALEAIKKEELI